MGRIIQTNLRNKDFIFLFDDDHKVSLIKNINKTMVDTIYKGKIDTINEGLRACFVTISSNERVFLSLDEFNGNIPKCGDEIIVQIKTDPLKTKLAQGTINLCIPGQYCVCHINGIGLTISRKLDPDIQKALLEELKKANISELDNNKWVIRTNSEFLLNDNIEPLVSEIKEFSRIADFINNEAKYRSIYSVIYRPTSEIVSIIGDIPYDEYDSIITDNEQYFNELTNSAVIANKKLQFHDDKYISLKNLHSLETYLDRALDKKVYLNSGGYLIIEPTEALTVIDVNSGKMEGRKKDSESYKLKVNKEAAIEISKQLKIRNISGIIMVDFINMTDDKNNKCLLDLMDKELKKDKTRCRLVDMTPLGIVEITRKKISAPLS